jgi:ADP-glucose pyrophosphorylase
VRSTQRLSSSKSTNHTTLKEPSLGTGSTVHRTVLNSILRRTAIASEMIVWEAILFMNEGIDELEDVDDCVELVSGLGVALNMIDVRLF